MGPELFDHAFKTYAQRWMFKHPTPEDFFRTMEDASAVDLDWYWRVTDKPTKRGKEMLERFGITPSQIEGVYVVEEGDEEFDESMRGKSLFENAPTLKEYILDNFTPEERANIEEPKYLYNVVFEKPGGIPMPLIVEYEYADGSTEKVTYPAQIWRKNDIEVSKAIASDKEITKITVDPDLETADIDADNNSWPKPKKIGKFENFKDKVKG